jgi:elongation factor G
VALTRTEGVATGDVLTSGAAAPARRGPERPQPVYGMAIHAEKRSDDVKLSGDVQNLMEEEPTLHIEHNPDTGEFVLWGQGEVHLQIALDRMRQKYNLPVVGRRPAVAYKETIRRGTEQHARFKRQSGGHGQFADITIEVTALPRGSGFAFTDSVVGGAIPRNYIPSVEEGIVDYCKHGPLGFPVVDVTVALTDGSYHTVDSSDAAFQTAGRLAMSEGMPGCAPVLLEPVMRLAIHVPSDATAKVNGVIGGRRGVPLGFEAREGWRGWDTVRAELPLSETGDLIMELRSLTQGLGTYEMVFDRLAELNGKLADQVVLACKAA